MRVYITHYREGFAAENTAVSCVGKVDGKVVFHLYTPRYGKANPVKIYVDHDGHVKVEAEGQTIYTRNPQPVTAPKKKHMRRRKKANGPVRKEDSPEETES